MSETNGNKSSQGWSSTQAYIMAVLCLLVGCAVGYLLRGSLGGNSTPTPAAAGIQQQPGAQQQPTMGGQPQQPSAEQLKAMADKQAAPLLDQLKTKPNDPELLAQVGNLYYDAHDFPVAIDYYQKSLASKPKNPPVRTDMATALFYTNSVDQAISEFDRALQDDPKYGDALFDRGMVKWQGKMDIKGAMADWELLLKENPNYPQADRVKTLMEQLKKHMNIKPGQQANGPAM